MNTNTKALHNLDQSIWLDNITRDLLDDGTLARYIRDLSVTGLTSNPTIFEHAMSNGTAYDEAIKELVATGFKSEALFFELAMQDLTRAADLFRPIFDATKGVDGWVSLEVSPLLANNTAITVKVAADLYMRAARPNLFIKIPGTEAGIPAIEESIFAGVPVNVTLLFSRDQYLAAAHAYMTGIQRRLDVGLDPKVGSVASLFVSRWDAAVAKETPPALHNRLGIAVAMRAYNAYRELLVSKNWRKLEDAGAHPQRLLWASTGTKDPHVRDTLYVEALVAPKTINTMPEKTLLAFADHGKVDSSLSFGDDLSAKVMEEFRHVLIDETALAAKLQHEGAESFNKSWHALIAKIEEKTAVIKAQ